ncbi:hypothetical protein [Flavobacterium anhuiense]|uniref:hypothetical protein n=1 Tax=Flavobacterium anhuiense TaxID=459526 RepID=UPI0013C425AB|nr:hypothetical protein [Flavobacterium anhuiense]
MDLDTKRCSYFINYCYTQTFTFGYLIADSWLLNLVYPDPSRYEPTSVNAGLCS